MRNSNSKDWDPKILLSNKPVQQARGIREPWLVLQYRVQVEEVGRPCPTKRQSHSRNAEWEAAHSGVTCRHVQPVRLLDASVSSAQELALPEEKPGLSSPEPLPLGPPSLCARSDQQRVRYRDTHGTSVLIN